jgi:hypothetical protein
MRASLTDNSGTRYHRPNGRFHLHSALGDLGGLHCMGDMDG